MSYVTPAQLKSGLQGAKDYVDSKGAGFTKAYIVGTTAFAPDWLSDASEGTAITPDTESVYVIQTAGDYFGNLYMWNGTAYYAVGGETSQGGGGSIKKAYIVGTGPRDAGWLSLEENGTALTPDTDTMYIIQTVGDYYARGYMWNGDDAYRIVAENANFEYKQSTEENQNPIAPVAIYARGNNAPGASYSFTVPEYTKSVRYQFNTSTYNLRCRMGVPGKEIDVGDTTYTKPFDRTVQITKEDWGKTFTLNLYRVTSDGSSSTYLQWNTLTIEKEWDEDTLVFLPPTTTEAGKPGLVPAAAAGTTDKVLTQDGWDETPLDITSAEIKEAFDEVAGGSSDMLPNEYSTEERMIGHWIDGKPLYRKMVNCNFTYKTAGSWVDTGASIPNLSDVKNVKVFRGAPNECAINYFYGDANGTNGQIRVVSDVSFVVERTYLMIIVEYTKTTD